jgi:hypothetical protein
LKRFSHHTVTIINFAAITHEEGQCPEESALAAACGS